MKKSKSKNERGAVMSDATAPNGAAKTQVPRTQMPKPQSTPSAPSSDLADQERLVGLEFIRATEAGALSAYKWMGKGDKESADFAACDAIRGLFDTVDIRGTVTIGEGIKDESPGIFK